MFSYDSVKLSDGWQGRTTEGEKVEGAYPIRLVRLHPKRTGPDAPLIEISLRQQDEPYEALSYFWGHPKDELKPISVYNNRIYDELEVTPNLFAALKGLRHEDNVRILWVDAICINQKNDYEKSTQIPLMDQIYSEATNVCIWLGEPGDPSENVEAAFEHIKDVIKLEGLETLICQQKTEHWAALAKLMRREWFSRRWVVQEVAFARQATVHCGSSWIEWPDFADAVALFGHKAKEISELFKGDPRFNHQTDYLGEIDALGANRLVQTISKTFRKADDGRATERLLSLEALVSNLSPFKAGKPHDIIYAILSLAKDTVVAAQPASGNSAMRPVLALRHRRGSSVGRGAQTPRSPRPVSTSMGFFTGRRVVRSVSPHGRSTASTNGINSLALHTNAAPHLDTNIGESNASSFAPSPPADEKEQDLLALGASGMSARSSEDPDDVPEQISEPLEANNVDLMPELEQLPKTQADWIKEMTQETLQNPVKEANLLDALNRIMAATKPLPRGRTIDPQYLTSIDMPKPIPKTFWNHETHLRLATFATLNDAPKARVGKAQRDLASRLIAYEATLAETFLRNVRDSRQNRTFHVNYQQTYFDVFQDFIRFTISTSNSLDMLCRPWAPNPEDLPHEPHQHPPRLPSWICPLSKAPFAPRRDGNFGRANADLLVGMPDARSAYSAASTTKPEFEFGGRGRRSLFVKGLLVDTISETDTEAVEGNIPNSWLQLADWKGGDRDPPESFWRTIVADRDEQGHNPPSYYKRACKHVFNQRIHGGSLNIEKLKTSTREPVMANYLKRVQTVVFMRKLMRTERDELGAAEAASGPTASVALTKTYTNGAVGQVQTDTDSDEDEYRADTDTNNMKARKGRLGLVPSQAIPGDFICVLRGCSVPVVLRKKEKRGRNSVGNEHTARSQHTQEPVTTHPDSKEGEKQQKIRIRCELIGECYVYGIMSGEAWHSRHASGRREYDFEIV